MKTLYILINWFLLFSYWLLISRITLRVLIKRRAVPAALAWLLIIYILPLVGAIMYMLLGEPNLGRRRYERSLAMIPSTTQWIQKLRDYPRIFSTKNSAVASSLFQLCEHRQGLGGLKGNHLQLISNTDEAINSMIKDIGLAQNSIEMVFYIWQVGGLADQVAEAFMAASRRRVKCRLMLDSAGSVKFFRTSYPAKMRLAGVDIVEALDVNIMHIFLRRMDLRQHRKMVLIDNYISYIGSMNMVDPRCFKQYTGVGQWIDIMARIEGPVTTAMGIIYSCDWEIETGERILPLPPDVNIASFEQGSGRTIQIIASGPSFPEGVIHQALLTSIYAAREKIVMTTPYLVPSDDLLRAICTAAHRGVNVHIIIPRNNDSLLVRWASRSFFAELLEAGVYIHQFEGGLLHTKSMLVDGQLSLVGSVNLDIRSLWLNFEIALVIDDDVFGRDLERMQDDYISRSQIIDILEWSQRPCWQRILERVFYFFSPLL